jgi:hypothetical protein
LLNAFTIIENTWPFKYALKTLMASAKVIVFQLYYFLGACLRRPCIKNSLSVIKHWIISALKNSLHFVFWKYPNSLSSFYDFVKIMFFKINNKRSVNNMQHCLEKSNFPRFGTRKEDALGPKMNSLPPNKKCLKCLQRFF